MKIISELTLITLLYLIPRSINAQGATAVPLLNIHPSANYSGIAGAYTALYDRDAFAYYYNPAHLGNFSQNENFSLQYTYVDWLPQYSFSDLYFKAIGFSSGYNLRNLSNPIPLSIGIGYMRVNFSLGTNYYTDELGNPLGIYEAKEWYDAYSIGFCYDKFIRISAGFTFKSIVSDLSPSFNIIGFENSPGKVTVDAFDTGIQLMIPFASLYKNIFQKKNSDPLQLYPITNFSFGMVLMNVGDEINYFDTRFTDPLPREAKIGYAISLGVSAIYHEVELIPIKVSWSTEANDLLIEWRDEKIAYQSFPGDINILDNFLLNKSDELVLNRHGFVFDIFETFRYSFGRFSGRGFGSEGFETTGYSISSRGLFKILTNYIESPTWKNILNHVSIQYSDASYEAVNASHPLSDTHFQSVSLNIYGF